MISLLLRALGLAMVLASIASAASRPAPALPSPAEALPVAALGLRWRHLRYVQARNGPRGLWAGDGEDLSLYRRAYAVARDGLRAVGYSWADVGAGTQPVCWADPAVHDRTVKIAVEDACAAVCLDDHRRQTAEAARRRSEELEAALSGDARREALAALATSLRTLRWAWPTRKRKLAEGLIKGVPEGAVPTAYAAQLARALIAEVDAGIEAVRIRVWLDPVHDWLAKAQDEGMRTLSHQAVRFVTEPDGDMACLRNDQGWGRSHTRAGHVLAAEPVLSVIQASQALAAVHRHRRQLPPARRRALFGDE